jgi:signal transduction histidine kinase
MESHCNQSNRFGNTEDFRNFVSSDFFCQAIENADGVPFQLIFGPKIGEGYYLTIGSGIAQLLHISPQDFTEKRYYEMIKEIIPLSNDIPKDPAESRRKFINGEIKTYRAEVLLQMPGGEKKWIRDAALPLLDEETGKVIGALGILMNINYRSKIVKPDSEENSDTDDNERLKNAFLRNISHEIRTPLNAIVGFSTLLGEPGHTPEQQSNFRNIITRNTDHLLEIINDIVEMSDIETGAIMVKNENLDPWNLLTTVYKHFSASAAAKGIFLSFSSSGDIIDYTLLTDSYKVKHVLDNLICNALKFTRYGKVEFGIEMKEGRAEFFVSDTGIGIPEEHREKIFNRFYQCESSSSRKYEGIGLGLTLAKAYVEVLGGRLWFATKPGEGSEFRFYLPEGAVKKENGF